MLNCAGSASSRSCASALIGNGGMALAKKCPVCGVNFEASNGGQMTCSVTCGRRAMHDRRRRVLGVEKNCAHCGTAWIAMPKDRARFCSWECHAADKGHREKTERECLSCGKVFTHLNSASRDGHGKYCSKDCSYSHRRDRINKHCLCCGAAFEVQNSNSDARFCTKLCADTFLSDSRSPHWKGGSWVSSKGFRMIYLRRPGYSSKYETEHRIVAARSIGRPIAGHEIVIHLDNDKLNNDPSNLYIFGSRSAWVKVQMGKDSLWPAASNLGTYR